MRAWLTSGEYQALLWEDHHEVVAYALFRDSPPYTFFLLNGDMELHRNW
jgi:hypothetical protein